jgi:hypothetical protein
MQIEIDCDERKSPENDSPQRQPGQGFCLLSLRKYLFLPQTNKIFIGILVTYKIVILLT